MAIIGVFLVALLLMTPMLAQGQTLFGGPTVVDDPTKAADYVQTESLIPLVEGVTVLGVVDGGFQDRFVQIKLEVPDDVTLRRVLDSLAVTPDGFVPGENAQMTIAAAPFWNPDEYAPMPVAQGRLLGFSFVNVGLARPEKSRTLLFILAFQT
ncbi:hypothetical protein [Neogemmobacter tilapiae]|uniref:Uncharacterized protein n=1 Tax=Neogemmobacter tilapiae TaxID=875041 RepID=A0A918TFF5_9RHOB|nr:hypothetical protein [Gemmobacter tilapiae]GHC44023.1 hypothetical protein GCM10007315_01440 [Gemmobacter tilapiae]